MPPKKKKASRRTAMSAVQKTADFIIALSQHPELKAEWKRDPDGTMKYAGLGDEAMTALKSGDPERVRDYLGDDAPPGCFLIIFPKR